MSKSYDEMTVSERWLYWANESIFVQSACNAAGVAHSLARLMVFLGSVLDDTSKRNGHFLVQLFVAKLADLAAMEYTYPFEAEKKAQMIVDAGAREDFNRMVII